ncbi:MAG: LysM peptidoglycan-binding domain-containing M23 family metallopeptidase [Spirochaetia bacterium]|jgi:murein DD-endopeptidase MepM/ murein hydrolase activator NlpD|nr:LysM peptidoglycan-binding domain-containing M23 family metallopeptidase [Spirochaetia bacterium]
MLLGILFPGFGEDYTHIVREGETFYGIARKYGTSAETLMKANNIGDPARLRPGTRLLLPDMYKVQKGDTLYAIARKFGCDVPVLLTLNNLSPDSLIKPGDLLSVPGGGGAGAGGQSAPRIRETPPAAAEAPAGEGDSFWPHPGAKKTLDGKLEGLSFEGRAGDAVLAVASGKVIWVGPYRGFGQVVFVQSGQGYIYVYAGNDDILVSYGEAIRKGQKLATMGVNPYEGKSSLYFIVYKDGKPVKPEAAPRI